MFSHLHVGVLDFERAFTFYARLLPALGLSLRFCDRTRPWAGWQAAHGGRPLFLIGRPFDGQPHQAGNGQMTAFLADTREQVRLVHAAALAAGGIDEGPPGLRPHYHAHYYGAYVRDTEGNKLCVVCHAPSAEGPAPATPPATP